MRSLTIGKKCSVEELEETEEFDAAYEDPGSRSSSEPLCRKSVGAISIPTVSPRLIPADSLVNSLHTDREDSGIHEFERKIVGRVRK